MDDSDGMKEEPTLQEPRKSSISADRDTKEEKDMVPDIPLARIDGINIQEEGKMSSGKHKDDMQNPATDS